MGEKMEENEAVRTSNSMFGLGWVGGWMGESSYLGSSDGDVLEESEKESVLPGESSVRTTEVIHEVELTRMGAAQALYHILVLITREMTLDV